MVSRLYVPRQSCVAVYGWGRTLRTDRETGGKKKKKNLIIDPHARLGFSCGVLREVPEEESKEPTTRGPGGAWALGE